MPCKSVKSTRTVPIYFSCGLRHNVVGHRPSLPGRVSGSCSAIPARADLADPSSLPSKLHNKYPRDVTVARFHGCCMFLNAFSEHLRLICTPCELEAGTRLIDSARPWLHAQSKVMAHRARTALSATGSGICHHFAKHCVVQHPQSLCKKRGPTRQLSAGSHSCRGSRINDEPL